MAQNIAIVIITYNRLDSLKRLIKSLEASYYNQRADLIISIDKSSTTAIEDFAKEYHWAHGPYRFITHEINLGLRKHVLSCGKLFSEYEALIVLEDDIMVSPDYFKFSCECVDKYAKDSRIAGISLYSFRYNYQNLLPFIPMPSEYDVFFMNCAQSWGQVWLREQWIEFMAWYKLHKEGYENAKHLPSCLSRWPKSSWLKYHTRYCIEKDKYFVYPYTAFTTNCADVGIHVDKKNNLFQVPLKYQETQRAFILPDLDSQEIKYDGFFESKFISSYLNLDKELCVDMFGEKPSCLYKKYLLTTKDLPYKVIRSFDMSLKPIESNIIHALEGNEIFLYDLETSGKSPKSDVKNKYDYYYGSALTNLSKMHGIKIFANNIIKKAKQIAMRLFSLHKY